jgi:hypothetical protein
MEKQFVGSRLCTVLCFEEMQISHNDGSVMNMADRVAVWCNLGYPNLNLIQLQGLIYAADVIFWEAQWNADTYNTEKQGQ